MRNIIDYTEGKLQEAIKVSRELKDPSLIRCLQSLRIRHRKGYMLEGGYTTIYKDFAPLSFGFTHYRANKTPSTNGGIIFHGKHDGYGSGSAPTFSVSLNPANGWQIHT